MIYFAFSFAALCLVSLLVNNYYLKQKINTLHRIAVSKTEEVNLINGQIFDYYKVGAHLLTQPFIPEYLGFEHTELKDKKTNLFEANIYTKDGYNIGRSVDYDKPEWIILDPSGGKTETLIDNLYDGITKLNALGMKLSVKEYVQPSTKQ